MLPNHLLLQLGRSTRACPLEGILLFTAVVLAKLFFSETESEGHFRSRQSKDHSEEEFLPLKSVVQTPAHNRSSVAMLCLLVDKK